MMQQTKIPAGLHALIQAQQALRALQQQAAPMGPAGPTVAGSTEAALSQVMQPQVPVQGSVPQFGMPQGPGNPQMPPANPGSVAQAAQMSAIAGQQQQAQQQQAMQQAMQMAQQQQQPQQMARGGLASLRADNISRLKYARGGVIGFDGTDGSRVEGEEEKKSGILKALAATLGMPVAAVADVVGLPINLIRRYSLPGVSTGKESITPAFDVMRRYTGVGAEAAPAAPAASPAPDYAQDISPPAMQRPPAGEMLPSVRDAVASAQPAAPQVNPDLEAVRKLRDAQFTGTEPTAEGLMQEREKFRTAQGLSGLSGSSIEQAVQNAKAREDAARAAYQEGTQGRGMEQLIGMLSAGARGPVGSAGAQYVRGQQEARQADMAFRQLMDESAAKRDQMTASVQAMREAAANQDADAFQKAKIEYRKVKHDFDTVNRQLASSALQASTTMQEGALDRASRERMETARLAAQAKDLGMRKLELSLNSVNSTLSAAQKRIEDELTKTYGMFLTRKQVGGWEKDPEMVKMNQEYLQAKQNLENKYLAPIIEQRDRLTQSIEGSTGLPSGVTVTRKP